MTIGLLGVGGYANRGVEALATVIHAELAVRLPGVAFRQYLRKPAECEALYPRTQAIRTTPVGTVETLRAALARRIDWRFHHCYNSLRQCRLIIFTGGDVLTDSYGVGSYRYWLRLLAVAVATGRPVAAFSLSAGPLPAGEDPRVLGRLLDRCASVSAREGVTLEFLNAIMTRKAVLAPDPAFLLEPDPIIRPSHREPLVAIAPSAGFARWSGIPEEKHLEALADFVADVTTRTGSRVLLLPHTIGGPPEANDALTIERLRPLLPKTAAVEFVEGEPRVAALKARLGACRIVVAERMHAAIGAASQGIPTLFLAYSNKAKGMAKLLSAEGGPPSPNVLDASEVVVPGALRNAFDAVNQDHDLWARHLEKRAAWCRGGLTTAFDALAEIAE